MLKKLANNALRLINGATKSNNTAPTPNTAVTNGAMCNQYPSNYPQGLNSVDLNISYRLNAQYSLEFMRQLEAIRQYNIQQAGLSEQQLYRQHYENAATNETIRQRFEYQAQMIAQGADPNYYARLNQAYNEGLRGNK